MTAISGESIGGGGLGHFLGEKEVVPRQFFLDNTLHVGYIYHKNIRSSTYRHC